MTFIEHLYSTDAAAKFSWFTSAGTNVPYYGLNKFTELMKLEWDQLVTRNGVNIVCGGDMSADNLSGTNTGDNASNTNIASQISTHAGSASAHHTKFANSDITSSGVTTALGFTPHQDGTPLSATTGYFTDFIQIDADGEGNPHTNAVYAYNSTNSSGADAIITTRVGGASAGDAIFSIDVQGVTGWSIGLDNSDSDSFKISNACSLLLSICSCLISTPVYLYPR